MSFPTNRALEYTKPHAIYIEKSHILALTDKKAGILLNIQLCVENQTKRLLILYLIRYN